VRSGKSIETPKMLNAVLAVRYLVEHKKVATGDDSTIEATISLSPGKSVRAAEHSFNQKWSGEMLSRSGEAYQ